MLLLRRRNKVVAAGIVNGIDTAHIAAGLFPAVRQELAYMRQLARKAGASRLEAEASRLGFEVMRRGTIVAHELAIDAYRANSAAKSYIKRWLGKAHGETLEEAATRASEATHGSLRRIVATENAIAYNEGRIVAAKSLALFRQWDAVLDAHTCFICREADGTFVPIG